MCGIFAIYYLDSNRTVDIEMVEASTDVMHHRGPDDFGYHVDGNIGLGHRRLSIIDLSSGHQPMSNEDGRIIVVYNGEIYNYKEIRDDLLAKGHIFRTDCDTEVIIHGYEEWGKESLKKFNGMFAFALYDKCKQMLWVVRDRLGIKPLYYYQDKNVFIAASEVKAILRTGIVKSALNENVIDAYLSIGYVPGPETMFKGIKKLLPGHFLIVQKHGLTEREYWDFANIPSSLLDEKAAFEKIENLLSDCVKKRLISDVPIGAFLSGGLDSSFVVGLMNKLIAPKPVDTFTVAYNQGYSEKTYAQTIADQFRTNHHLFYLNSDDFFHSIETLVRFSEEPIVEPAAIALYHIAILAKKHATVLLSGEGSDEVFGGYYLYQLMAKIDSLRRFIPEKLLPHFSIFGMLSNKKKYKKYMDWISMPLTNRYQGISSYLTQSLKKELYHEDFLKDKSSYLEEQFDRHFQKVADKDSLRIMQYVDTKTWLVDDLLLKADKMTMAASIELRVPFLDYRLVEAVASLPINFKIKSGQGKYLLKEISKSLLPNQIIYRKKMGFPVPTNEWFSENLMPQITDVISTIKKYPWFKSKTLDNLLYLQKKGTEDQSKILMTLLILNAWLNQYA